MKIGTYPRGFGEIAGHEKAKSFLSRVLARPPKAVLLAGPDGVGKCVAAGERIEIEGEKLPIADVYDDLLRRTRHNVVVACPRTQGEQTIVWANGTGLYDGAGMSRATCFYRSRVRELWRVTSASGFRLSGTAEHPVRVWTRNAFAWMPLSAIEEASRASQVWLCCVRPPLEFKTDEIRWRKVDSLASMGRPGKPLPRGVRRHARELEGMERHVFALELLLGAGPALEFRDEEDAVECHEHLSELGIPVLRSGTRLERTEAASYNWLLRRKEREDLGRKLTNFQRAARTKTPLAFLATALRRVIDAAVAASPTMGLKTPVRELREGVALDHALLDRATRMLEDHECLDDLRQNPKLAADLAALEEFRRNCYFFDEFASAERMEASVDVFDAWLPCPVHQDQRCDCLGTHAFKSNMFLSHNTSLGRIYAAGVLCRKPRPVETPGAVAAEPCGECDSCLALSDSGLHPDIFEEPATGRGMDFIRAATEFASTPSAAGADRPRVIVIPEAQDLQDQAAACLIDALDERADAAPGRFVFTSSAPQRLLPAIRQRAVPLQLHMPAPEDVERFLLGRMEGLTPADAKIIARRAESMRSALTLAKARVYCPMIGIEELLEPAPKQVLIAVLRAILSRDLVRISEQAEGLVRLMSPQTAYQKVFEVLHDLFAIRLGKTFAVRHLDPEADHDTIGELSQGFGVSLEAIACCFARRAEQDVRIEHLTMDLVSASFTATAKPDDPAGQAARADMLKIQHVEEMRNYTDGAKGMVKDYSHLRRLGVKKKAGKDGAPTEAEDLDSVRQFYKELEPAPRKSP